MNDSLTNTNYLQSFEDDLTSITFLEGEFMYKFKDDGNLLYITSLDVIGNGTDSYYGKLDLENPTAGVNNKFINNSIIAAMGLKNGIVYYFDFEANEIKSVDIMSPNAEEETILRNVLKDVNNDFLEEYSI
ncbi:MAG: hypothetical protein AAGF85_05965 [Bacteroidota bacterium]